MSREPRKVNQEALVDLLRSEGLDFYNSANSLILNCPECGKQKWAIRKTDGYSKCYHCGDEFKGFSDYTLSIVLKRSKSDLSKLLYGVNYTTEKTEIVTENRWVDHWEEETDQGIEVTDVQSWPPEMIHGPDHYELDSAIGKPGLEYLQSRGIDLELAKEYGIKYNAAKQRVILPIVVEGVLRGWQGRQIKSYKYTDKKGRERESPKILTEGEVGGKVLIFQDRLKNSPHGLIVEGPFDAIKCHLIGGNAATMGKSVTSAQLDIYVRYFGLKKLYIGLDADASEDIMRIARDMTWYKDVEVYQLEAAPGREDLGAGTLEENLEQFRLAKKIQGINIRYLKTHQFYY